MSYQEFAKFLGREGICRVEEDEKGVWVSWVDNSPENLRRQDAIRKKERQDRGDEEREQAAIREQVRRAKMDAEDRGEEDLDEAERELKRNEGEKIKLNFGVKPAVAKVESPAGGDLKQIESALDGPGKEVLAINLEATVDGMSEAPVAEAAPAKISMKMGVSSKPKNIFSAAKKNVLGGKKATVIEQPKKMSEAERIMKEEMERKRSRGPSGFGGPPPKKQKL
jgi:DNA/RNA-binding protein KIN17